MKILPGRSQEFAGALMAVLVSALIASAAVPSATGQSSVSVGTPTTSAQGTAITVTIPSGTGADSSLNFSPASLKLVVGVNNTVTWRNDDSTTHSVTAADGSFNVTLAPGGTFTHTFGNTGTFTYHCVFHSYMRGTVTVLAASAGSQGGIPEFPFTWAAVAVISFLVVLSYLAVRRTRRG